MICQLSEPFWGWQEAYLLKGSRRPWGNSNKDLWQVRIGCLHCAMSLGTIVALSHSQTNDSLEYPKSTFVWKLMEIKIGPTSENYSELPSTSWSAEGGRK